MSSSSSIESKQLTHSNNLKKSRYFEKYRNELNLISSKIKKPKNISSPVLSQQKIDNGDSLRMTAYLPSQEFIFRNSSSNESESISKINTERSSESRIKIQYRESIKMGDSNLDKGDESRVIIHTFTDLSQQNINGALQSESASIRQSFILEKIPSTSKKSNQLTVEQPILMRANTENRKTTEHQPHFPFTFSNLKVENIPKRNENRRNTTNFDDAIESVGHFRSKSPITPDSNNSSSKRPSPNLSFSPSPLNQTNRGIKVPHKRQNTDDLSKNELRSSYRSMSRRKQSDLIMEVESMVKQYQHLKTKIEKTDVQIKQKRDRIEALKEKEQGNSEMDYMKNIVSYAEKILQIQGKIKQVKKKHEVELETLSQQKKHIHQQNIVLSKTVESCEQQIENLKIQYETLQKKQPSKVLEAKATKLQTEIQKLHIDIELGERRKNNSQELEDLSYAEFKKFSDAWLKKLYGKEIKQAQQRIKIYNPARYEQQIQKKKDQLKEKKIQIQLRRKSVIQLNRVIQNIQKSIGNHRTQLHNLNHVERKISIFHTHSHF